VVSKFELPERQSGTKLTVKPSCS